MDEVSLLSELVLRIQEAALAPGRWNGVVDAIVGAVGGSEGILFSPSAPPALGGFWASRSLAPHHMEDYAAYYLAKDVWRQNGEAQMKIPGAVVPDEALVSVAVVRKSEFYSDFLRRLGIGRLLCGIVAPADSPSIPGGLHLSVFRPMSKGGFDDRQQQLLRRLMPHLQTAILTQRALGAGDRFAAVGEVALQALATAVLLVEREGKVVFANEAARQLLAKADGISTTGGVLGGADASSTQALRSFVARMFLPELPGRGPDVLRIERPSGRPAYACFGQLLRPDGVLAGAASRPVALLVVRDPASCLSLEPEIVARLHGFTPAEALLASALARGLSLDEAAKERGIRYQTARTQLKNLFMKTGCSRQAELVAYLAGSDRI